MAVLKQTPVISVKGKPFDCGLQHGTQARELIRRNLANYFRRWQATWGAERSEILRKCHQLVPVIGEYDNDILEELQGLARGADLSLEEIIALNARYELIWGERVVRFFSGGCTSVAALPEVTRDGHTIIGMNWDNAPILTDMLILLEVEQPGKPKVVVSTEAGLLGLKGTNSTGLGMCVNGLVSAKDKFDPTCVPFLLMMRSALNAENFTRSLQAILRAKCGVPGNLLFAHRDGETIDLEVTPDDVGIVHDKDGILTHSNHFLTFTNRADFKDLFKKFVPNSLFRYHRARRLLEMDRGHIDIASFQRVFRDHFSYPDSICWHVNPKDDEHNQTKTLNSIIMDLTEGTMYLSEGNPCEKEYVRLTPFAQKARARNRVTI